MYPGEAALTGSNDTKSIFKVGAPASACIPSVGPGQASPLRQ